MGLREERPNTGARANDGQEFSGLLSENHETRYAKPSLDDYESVIDMQASLDMEVSRLLEADASNDKQLVERQVVITIAYAEALKSFSKYDERDVWEVCGSAIERYDLDINVLLDQVDEVLNALSGAEQEAIYRKD